MACALPYLRLERSVAILAALAFALAALSAVAAAVHGLEQAHREGLL